MRYNPNEIEARWQKYWAEEGTFRAEDKSDKPKYYVLDMFPYPSGAGLHVGHPLGYIASDIYARYKRHQGFNVLHPQGYDSFGLPAEQYAIQTGQHPAVTTEANIARYRQQLDKIGFSFDWDREVRTSAPEYYKWTQWIFIQLYNSWYNKDTDKAESICTLIAKFEANGNAGVNAVCDDNIAGFTAADWNSYTKTQQEKLLLKYRLTYLAETEVNWCPALGTVLANDEIVNGVSERGGHPVIRKKMTQWSMRISAYAERFLQGLDTIDWSESIKESQRNWIGKSVGASVTFKVKADVNPNLSPSNLTPNPSPKERVTQAGSLDRTPNHTVLTPSPSPKERGASSDPGYLTGDSAVIKDSLHYAKGMRKEPTPAESALWEVLRNKNLGVKFRRQHPIGVFIADFVTLEKRLIIEVDGGYHTTPEQTDLDLARAFELEQKHLFKVIRFTNQEVLNTIDAVINKIRETLKNRPSYKDDEPGTEATPPPSEGAGGRTNPAEVRPQDRADYGSVATPLSGEDPGVRPQDRADYGSVATPPPSEGVGGRTSNPTILEGLGLQSFFDDITSPLDEEDASKYTIEVFTTRPDTIFGVTFMTLAPEHELVAKITTAQQKPLVDAYVQATAKRSERERMADVKTISGVFTGAYAEHPFTKEPIPVWIGDYVLAGYGTGAVMAVPAGDQRDYDFAKHFGIPIKNIFQAPQPPKGELGPHSLEYGAFTEKGGFKLINSDFLDGDDYKTATKKVISALEGIGQGQGKTNYRLRDAVFSRQRYWGEPFPVYYVDGMPQMIATEHLPIRLPEVEKYLPTEDGQPPLGNAKNWYWNTKTNSVSAPPAEAGEAEYIFPLELNTMPGWAGSSWYWLRYMDPHNTAEFVSPEAQAYWQDVDLYIGGSEHATGHLLYSRFWNKFLKDRGYIQTEEPFKKLINQGMILGLSAFVYTHAPASIDLIFKEDKRPSDEKQQEMEAFAKTLRVLFTASIYNKLHEFDENLEVKLRKAYQNLASIFEDRFKGYRISFEENFELEKRSPRNIYLNTLPFHVDVNYVNASNELDIELFKQDVRNKDYVNAEFILNENGKYIVGREVEKMSKSKYNVVTPDDICEQYGADTLRLYEMFLGPLEQAKPWNTAGITGVSGFLKKLWKLYFDDNGLIVTANPASKEAYKILHRTIKKTQDDIENFSFNTSVSSFMIAVNELTAINCHERTILEPLAILLSPYAPHIAEELWHRLGHQGSISKVPFPIFNAEHLVESSKEYPVSFNGKTRFKIELPMDLSKEEIEAAIMADERTAQQLNGQQPKKVIVVPGKIINIVG